MFGWSEVAEVRQISRCGRFAPTGTARGTIGELPEAWIMLTTAWLLCRVSPLKSGWRQKERH